MAIAILFAIDTLLAKTERSERRAEAARLYGKGEQLLNSGQAPQAVEQLRGAVAIERDNKDYQLALAEALRADGKLREAESTLNAFLEQDPFGGRANLAMARVLLAERNVPGAVSYYHRAIYGQWNADAQSNPLRVRFELAELLSRQNSREALLAELLPLQGEAPNDPATSKKLAQLFMAAGSAARAADVYREILRADPQDAGAHAGLGEAEFAAGNYRAAREAFLATLHLHPDDENARARANLSNEILELDPTVRGLGPDEQYSRSRRLLELALDEVKQCPSVPASPTAQELMSVAGNILKRGHSYTENLELAEKLEHLRRCQGLQPDALSIVVSKLSQK